MRAGAAASPASASLVAVWLAAQEYPQLARGETVVVVDVAPDRRQASIDLDYSRGLVEGSAILAPEATSTQETIAFRHRTQLEVATASFLNRQGKDIGGRGRGRERVPTLG